jgi:hypothetical protein
MPFIAGCPAFYITEETAEKLKTISPATTGRHLGKDKEALRLKRKNLAKPLDSLKSRIPTRAFSASEERKKIRTVFRPRSRLSFGTILK